MSHIPDVIKERLDRFTSTSSVEEVTKDEANRASSVEEETKGDINRDEIRRSHRLKLKAQRIMRQKGAGGFAMSNISVRKTIKHDPKRAAEAIHKELEQMLKGKKVSSLRTALSLELDSLGS